MKKTILYGLVMILLVMVTSAKVYDNFDDNSYDSTKWLNGNVGVCDINSVTEASGQMKILTTCETTIASSSTYLQSININMQQNITGNFTFNINDHADCVATSGLASSSNTTLYIIDDQNNTAKVIERIVDCSSGDGVTRTNDTTAIYSLIDNNNNTWRFRINGTYYNDIDVSGLNSSSNLELKFVSAAYNKDSNVASIAASAQNIFYMDILNLPNSSAPIVTFVSPTPTNGSDVLSNNVIINATVTDRNGISSCLLEWNGVNETMNSTVNNCIKNKQVIDGTNYTYRIFANDTLGNLNGSLIRTFQAVGGYLKITATNAINGSTINVFTAVAVNANETVTKSTTNGSLIMGLLKQKYNVSVNASGYATNTSILTMIEGTFNHSITLYTTNSFNITFYDAKTAALLTGVNVTLQVIGGTTQSNTTSTGKLYIDLLVPGEYTFVFNAPGYRQNQYITTLLTQSHQNINLYLNNESLTSLVLIEVQDKFGNSLSGVEVSIQRYTNNAWVTEQIVETDFQGRTEGQFTLSTVYYNFILEYLGNVEFGAPNSNANKKLIYAEDVANGLLFTIDILAENILPNYQDIYGVTSNMTYVNTTNSSGTFIFRYDDVLNNQWYACLEVTKGNNWTYVCNCSGNSVTSEASTLTCAVSQPTGRLTYSAGGFLGTNPQILVESLTITLGQDTRVNFGTAGYLFGFFLVVLSFFLFLRVPTIGLFIGTIVFVMLALLGVMFKDIGYGVLISLLVITYFVASIKSESGING